MKITEIKPVPLDPNDVRGVLEDALAKEFNSVIVFGFKDSTVSVMKSGIIDKIKVIGALEVAKQNLWME